MPSVIFHVRGKKFCPVVELAKTKLKPCRIHHVGDVVKRKRGGFVHKDSGFSVDLGPDDDDDLATQIKVAARFIKKHFTGIKRLKNADEKTLDFGYGMRFDQNGEPFWVQSNKLPADFLKLCGELKIEIELSFYYGSTVDKLISHYVKVLKLKHPKRTRAGK